MLQTYNVPATEMHCLFDRNASVELMPEPFRLQGNVCLQVALQEYQSYIMMAEWDESIKLSAPKETLASLAISGSQNLYRYFLRDVAFAIVKETMLSEKWAKTATIILPVAPSVKATSSAECAKLAVYSAKERAMLLQEYITAGFEYCEPTQPRNKRLLNVATVLYRVSMSQRVPDVISLSYVEDVS